MPAIGYVKRTNNGFEGTLNTISIKAEIKIVDNHAKSNDSQPHYLVYANGADIGAAWIRESRISGNDYVALQIAAPEFGSRKLYANLGVAAGQDDPDTFAIIWNPVD